MSSASTLKFRERTHFCLHASESLSCCCTDLYSSMLLHAGGAAVMQLCCLPLSTTCFALLSHLHISPRLFPQPSLMTTLSLSSRHVIPRYMHSVSYPYSPDFFFLSPLPSLLFLTFLADCVTLRYSTFPLLIPTSLISHQASIPKALPCSSISAFRPFH